MDRFLCIHAHFYQPPRENPWLEEIEVQDSAYPYHDWNERITAECYAPNGASRILNGDGRIVKIVNNYSSISFNFGPTLLSWMEKHAAQTYRCILDADAISRERFSGHGSALAQPYNHIIMPLAGRRDKHTQIVWGMRDFRSRFGRDPEGVWLPETAVDAETLDMLSEEGIRFTILAPHQAKQVRARQARQWRDVEGTTIDPTRPYYFSTRSGRRIALFFYDGPISRAVAFENLLSSGERFAGRLVSAFDPDPTGPQLVHIATDGETYGHHHAHGDMALAYALEYVQSRQLARITNYGEYLEKNPPTTEVEIIGQTSWSCSHGVARWERDCGCNSGGHGGWNQAWRRPLRDALDWLRDQLLAPYERGGARLLHNPRRARDEYIEVLLGCSPEKVDEFLSRHARAPLAPDEKVRALKLLEMQRCLMLMYTSCGWFFDELTGIETVQVLQYAGRAVQLAQELFGGRYEEGFLERLALAQSNLPELGNGSAVYLRFVKPAMVSLSGFLAHYAIGALLSDDPEASSRYAYRVEVLDSRRFESGRARLVLGNARIQSSVTREDLHAIYAVLHFGDHVLNAGVRGFPGDESYRALVEEAGLAFASTDFPACIRILDRHFGQLDYSLRSLFRDEQRRAVRQIVDSTLREAETSFQQLYDRHASLLRFLAEIKQPAPRALSLTADYVINALLRRALEASELDFDRIHLLLDAAQREAVTLDSNGLEFALRGRVVEIMQWLEQEPASLQRLKRAHATLAFARAMPFTVNLWESQNIYYQLAQQLPALQNPEQKKPDQKKPDQKKEEASWLSLFVSMGDLLGIKVPSSVLQAQA